MFKSILTETRLIAQCHLTGRGRYRSLPIVTLVGAEVVVVAALTPPGAPLARPAAVQRRRAAAAAEACLVADLSRAGRGGARVDAGPLRPVAVH